MFSLTKSLFDDLHSLHRELDSLFERSWEQVTGKLLPSVSDREPGFIPEMECFNRQGEVVYRMSIPGIDPKDVDLSIVGNQVTVKGERCAPKEAKEGNWYLREVRYGRFERTFTLPGGAELDKINASFSNGVLEISVPAAKAELPRKIEIKQIEVGAEKALKAGL
jgi:HSP20 family protein